MSNTEEEKQVWVAAVGSILCNGQLHRSGDVFLLGESACEDLLSLGAVTLAEAPEGLEPEPEPEESQRDDLEARAKALGITFTARTTTKTLASRVESAENPDVE